MYGYVVTSQEWKLIGSRSPQDAQVVNTDGYECMCVCLCLD